MTDLEAIEKTTTFLSEFDLLFCIYCERTWVWPKPTPQETPCPKDGAVVSTIIPILTPESMR